MNLEGPSPRASIVLSWVQVEPLLQARKEGRPAAVTSIDLGRRPCEASLSDRGATFHRSGPRAGDSSSAGVVSPAGDAPSAGGETLSWESLEEIAAAPRACFEVVNGVPHRIQAYSEQTGRAYSLHPTRGAPALLISGFTMHRMRDIDPWGDATAKVDAALPSRARRAGRLLDTCAGLGYTAIVAAERALEVVTIELDPAVQEIARRNPWSRPLLENPAISRLTGDAAEFIATFADGSFSRILHDPPALSLGGDLYSLAFYREARRVLDSGGRMFHYIGDPRSASGARTTRGVLRRLHEAGFTRVERRPEAFGVLAFK
jgi:predicted methyltransferase